MFLQVLAIGVRISGYDITMFCTIKKEPELVILDERRYINFNQYGIKILSSIMFQGTQYVVITAGLYANVTRGMILYSSSYFWELVKGILCNDLTAIQIQALLGWKWIDMPISWANL